MAAQAEHVHIMHHFLQDSDDSNMDYNELKKKIDRERKKKRRQDESYRRKENEKMAKKRQDHSFRERERKKRARRVISSH